MSVSLFSKIAGLKSETLLKQRLWQRYFPMNFAKFFRTTIEKPTVKCAFRVRNNFCNFSHLLSKLNSYKTDKLSKKKKKKYFFILFSYTSKKFFLKFLISIWNYFMVRLKREKIAIGTAWKVSVFGVILVHLFLLSVFSPNMGKYGPE